jgi:S-adenosylmethionine:tRNA ribosyltransferase-isomerase
MRLSEFAYGLPSASIAQTPLEKRDHSRMLIMDRGTGQSFHHHFYELPLHLSAGDVVVINDSQVMPARLTGKKDSGGLIEILLLSKSRKSGEEDTWDVLLKPAKRMRIGTRIRFAEDADGMVVDRLSDKKWRVCFYCPGSFADFLRHYGRAPLPPYIKRDKDREEAPYDLDRYQTVYARVPGSVAAPTAGFHFSPAVLANLRDKGIGVAPVTLHVGYGTFLPITATDVEDHEMEAEYFELSGESAEMINSATRVVAVGTTATRVIETVANDKGRLKAASGWTSLYVYPGYRFKRVEALLTNFHLPKSSLYLLTCAFGGKERIEAAYGQAIGMGYRFYSYGDCMLIR